MIDENEYLFTCISGYANKEMKSQLKCGFQIHNYGMQIANLHQPIVLRQPVDLSQPIDLHQLPAGSILFPIFKAVTLLIWESVIK